MERYCSSYLDRNGLYNDGFPCPEGTYCCEKDDGTKMCCQEVMISQTILQQVTKQSYTSKLATTKSNEFYQNLKKFNSEVRKQNSVILENFNKKSEQYIKPSNGYIREQSNISLLLSNPALLLGICLAFSFLVIITSLLLVCLFRFCNKSSNNNKNNQTKEKQNKNHPNSSSLSPDIYSRNSSSSGSSNVTSCTNTSLKGNAIIEDEDDEENFNECQKILTIDPNSHHQGHLSQMLGSHQIANSNLMLSNRSSNVNDYLLQTRLSSNNPNNIIHSNYSHTPSHYMNNAISSGSSSVCTSLLLNNLNANVNSANTTQSFVFNSQNFSTNLGNGPNFNSINDFNKDNLVDTDDETDPGDFISSTTSNLEYLKTHSLFNSTPLNYYPTLGFTGLSKMPIQETKEKPLAFPQPPVYSEAKTPEQQQPTITTFSSTSDTPVNIGDFRFSTFLPSNLYSKPTITELI